MQQLECDHRSLFALMRRSVRHPLIFAVVALAVGCPGSGKPNTGTTGPSGTAVPQRLPTAGNPCDSVLAVDVLKLNVDLTDQDDYREALSELFCSQKHDEQLRKIDTKATIPLEELPIPIDAAGSLDFSKRGDESQCQSKAYSMSHQLFTSLLLQVADNKAAVEEWGKCMGLQATANASGWASALSTPVSSRIGVDEIFQWNVFWNTAPGVVSQSPVFSAITGTGVTCDSGGLKAGSPMYSGIVYAFGCKRTAAGAAIIRLETENQPGTSTTLDAYIAERKCIKVPGQERPMDPPTMVSPSVGEGGALSASCPANTLIVGWRSFLHSPACACPTTCTTLQSTCSATNTGYSGCGDCNPGVGKVAYLELACAPAAAIKFASQTVGEDSTATATCPAGYEIVAYTSLYGKNRYMHCGMCTLGDNSCSVRFGNVPCGKDPEGGIPKSGTLTVACQPQFTTGDQLCSSRGLKCDGANCNSPAESASCCR